MDFLRTLALRSYQQALAELAKLPALAAELTKTAGGKAALAEAILEDTPRSGLDVGPVWNERATIFSDDELNTPPPDAPRLDLHGALWAVATGLRRHTVESLTRRLKTGLDQLPEPVPVVELPAGQRVRRLLQEISSLDEYAGLAATTRDLMAAIRLPTAVAAIEELALGGCSGLGNRGPLDRLLLSELAHDDLTLATRIALNEAVYLQREPPALKPEHALVIVLDSGLRMWGVPRVVAASAAMALVAGHHSSGAVHAWRPAGRVLEPVDLLSKTGLDDHFAVLRPELDARDALPALARELQQSDEPDVVFITHPDALREEAFASALGRLPGQRSFVLTVDHDGRAALHTLPWGSPRPLAEGADRSRPAFRRPAARPPGRAAAARARGGARFAGLFPAPGLSAPTARHGPDRPHRHHAHRRPGGHDRSPADAVGPARRTCGAPAHGRLARGENLLAAGRCRRPDHRGQGPGRRRPDVGDHRASAGRRTDCHALHGTAGAARGVRRPGNPAGFPAAARGRPLARLRRDPGRNELSGRPQLEWRTLFHAQSRGAVRLVDGQAASVGTTCSPGRSTIAATSRWPSTAKASERGCCCATESILSPTGSGFMKTDFPVIHAVVVDQGNALLVTEAGKAQQHVVNLTRKTVRRSDQPRGVEAIERGQIQPPTCSMQSRFMGIHAAPGQPLRLRKAKGLWLEIHVAKDTLRLAEASGNREDLLSGMRPLAAVPATAPIGCTLKVAVWPGGSRAWIDSRGLLHLRSGDASVPQLTLTLNQGQMAAWSDDGTVCGPEFFTGRPETAGVAEAARILEAFCRQLC
ncbi:MAG: hypothetical protein WDM96_00995 [Lacunisphaera sp.]